jgi:sulfonate transport system substrate-binding protein
LIGGLAGTVGLLGASRRARARTPLRLSYQLSSALLLVLREHRTLEDRLAAAGFDIVWTRYSSDIMRTGAVDFHSDVAEPVPLFTYRANPDLTLYAAEGPSPHAVAIIVRDDSPIRTLADLRGRTIGTTKGSASHCLLVRALDQAGLSRADVHPAFLDPADAAAAFQTGHIDAWAIYDPFLALTQAAQPVRALTDGAAQSMRYDRYYLVNGAFAKAHPDIVQTVFASLQQASAWIHDQPEAANQLLARLWGNVPLETVRRVNTRRRYDVRPIGPVDTANLAALDATFVKAGVFQSPIPVHDIPVAHTGVP